MSDKKAVPLALLGLALLYFAPFWVMGRVFIPGDFTSFVYPWRAVAPPQVHNLDLLDVAVFFYPQDIFLNERLKAGDLPLWNPHIFCGHPIVASGQSALMYPPRLLAQWLLPPAVAKTLLLMLHTAGTGLAMYGWLSHRGLSARAAGLGAVCWMLNACSGAYLELDHLTYMSTYLPLMLWAIDRRRWPALAVLGALCLQAGHLQMAFYIGLVVVFYTVQTIWLTHAWSLLVGFAGSAIGVLLMAAPTLLPFLELLQQSQRISFSFSELKQFSTSLSSLLLTLINPDLMGNPSRGFSINRSIANFPYYEYAAYIGLIPLALAVLAVIKAGSTCWKKQEIQSWGALAVCSLLFATATPLYRLVLLGLPILNRALPGRFLLLFIFSGCVLAAHGFEIWCRDEGARKAVARVIAAFSAATVMAMGGLTWWLIGTPAVARAWLDAHRDGHLVKVPPFDAGPGYLDQLSSGLTTNYLLNPNMFMTLAAGVVAWWMIQKPRPALLATFAAADLLLFCSHFNTTVPLASIYPRTPSIDFLTEQNEKGLLRVEKENAAFYNLLTPYGLNLVTGYESLFPKRYAETMRAAQPDGYITMRSVAFTQFDSPILSAMNLTYLLQAPLDLAGPKGWKKAFDQEARVFRNPKAQPRAFVRGQVKPFQTFEQALAYLGSENFDPAVEVVLENLLTGPVSPAANASKVEVELYEPDRVALRVDLPAPGVLILADTFYPGWTCRDRNGVEQSIFPANGTSRGVYLSAGRHELLYQFDPPRFKLGLKLCAGGLLLALVWAMTLARRRNDERERLEVKEPGSHVRSVHLHHASSGEDDRSQKDS